VGARFAGEPDRYLLHQLGQFYNEITAALKHMDGLQAVARFQDQMDGAPHDNYDGSPEWAALLRKLEREQPDYVS
jgi:hypothetical protein